MLLLPNRSEPAATLIKNTVAVTTTDILFDDIAYIMSLPLDETFATSKRATSVALFYLFVVILLFFQHLSQPLFSGYEGLMSDTKV